MYSRIHLAALLMGGALLIASSSADAATLAAPKAQTPAADATVESLPALTWGKVKSAVTYEVELSADRGFGSLVGNHSFSTGNTAFAAEETVADGTYFWRVRGLTPAGRAGKWSSVRQFRKSWTQRPNLLSATGGLALLQPVQPVVLRWSPVAYAAKYLVFVATDPSLATSVLDDRGGRGIETSGTVLAPQGSLAPGTYYWAVVPLDAQGHRGASSAVGSFTSAWPATTTDMKVTDLNADARVFDPELSWKSIAGAVAYDVEVNYSVDFAVSSKVCCTEKQIGTTVSPTTLLPNNTYYWRVRAIDASGNSGPWNVGPEFRKVFDDVAPTVPNLHMRDNLSSTPTDLDTADTLPDLSDPIVTWDPVPGASKYQVQATAHVPEGCDWTQLIVKSWEVANTSWVGLSRIGSGVDQPGPSTWPNAQEDSGSWGVGQEYCVRVLALAGDEEILSEWTQINGEGNAAFRYQPAAAAVAGTPVMAADDYLAPSGTVSPRTPLFTWKRIPQAASYWVVIARDQAFTNVVSVSFTEFAAYSPADALQDETTSYYWVVLPAKNKDGSGVFTSVAANQPRAFEKRSVPPAALTPDDGADIPGSPRFAWSAAEGAAKYRLQVAADSSFGALIDDITTAATSYTATKTYPVDTVLYWRVRAVDGSGNGLTFSSPVRTFRRRLPMPALAPDNPLGGGAIPSLSWSPVQGAESYDVHVDQTDGRRLDFNVKSAQFTPTAFYGNGVWHWQVRAVFPGSPSSPGPYTPMVPFTRAITAPADAKAERSSGRILLSWAPLEGARRYKVEIADATGFARSIQSVTTDLTAWAPDLSRLGYQKGGTLYWRVAAVDEGNNTGAFSSGTITLDKRLVVTASGKPKRRLKTLITIRVSDAGNTDIKGAKVVLAGAGVKVTRKTPKSGSVSFQIKPRKKGTITIKATRKGYKSATTKLRVR